MSYITWLQLYINCGLRFWTILPRYRVKVHLCINIFLQINVCVRSVFNHHFVFIIHGQLLSHGCHICFFILIKNMYGHLSYTGRTHLIDDLFHRETGISRRYHVLSSTHCVYIYFILAVVLAWLYSLHMIWCRVIAIVANVTCLL